MIPQLLVVAAALIGAASWQGAQALRTRSHTSPRDLDTYTFDDFARDFGRDVSAGSEELARRLALFQASLLRIRATNARNSREGRPWVAGIHRFMDWTHEERSALNGYKPARRSTALSTLQVRFSGNLSLDAISSGGLPKEIGPALRDQGTCGSCWAISAVEAVEAQLQRQGPASPELSAQALVDCVPNPQHCGGSGGCDGATGELAYAFMRDNGIPLESNLPYVAHTGRCHPGPWPAAQRATVSGWAQLPSNRAKPLMQALVERGPVVVAVDGGAWFDYESGIFDDCPKDPTLGHAVLAKGFGEDVSQKYWLIQNSWGEGWGEAGHIRLLRHEGDADDSVCGVDRKPQEGVGCDGGPAEVTVCGICGLLYDPLIPEGVRLVGDA